MTHNTRRISFEELRNTFYEILLKYGFSEKKAGDLAGTFAGSSLDGVYSHGVNRFPRFIDTVKKGYVKIDNEPERTGSSGVMEQWNGNLGPGILNARAMMNRAMELAGSNTIGGVGLYNTNHWMRGGTYGWQAAEAGFIGICFTNTTPNTLPWGGAEPRLGNNPLIMAIPRKEGHVVLDMAISQYSFGKIQQYALKNLKLPYPGGFDDKGKLTNDPRVLQSNEKTVPIGYWKGSALSLVLDMLAAVLSGGDPSVRIGKREEEYGLSQVFIAIKPTMISESHREAIMNEIIDFTHDVPPIGAGERTYYPGEKTLITRNENRRKGIPVDKNIWKEIITIYNELE